MRWVKNSLFYQINKKNAQIETNHTNFFVWFLLWIKLKRTSFHKFYFYYHILFNFQTNPKEFFVLFYIKCVLKRQMDFNCLKRMWKFDFVLKASQYSWYNKQKFVSVWDKMDNAICFGFIFIFLKKNYSVI